MPLLVFPADTVLATLASGTLYDSGVPNPTLERKLSPQSIPVVGGSQRIAI
jgi:hypothetical protein